MSYRGKHRYVLDALKASLLQWLANPSILTAEANEIANNMFAYIEKCKNLSRKDIDFENFVNENRTLINTNKTVFTSVEITLLLPHLAEENNFLEWINIVDQGPNCLITDLYHFLCGLFLTSKLNSEIVIKIFDLILKNIEINKTLTSQILTLILFKLTNTTDSKLHFVLLKSFPKMVMLRENIPKVMAALQALSKASVDLYNFSLSLIFDVWKLDNKCYSYLENMLIQNNFSEKKWDTYVTKSFILKELCHRK